MSKDGKSFRERIDAFLAHKKSPFQKKELHYRLAVSSGLTVSQEVPQLIGRRAGWASQQGVNFIELYIGNPAQLIMDKQLLVNNAAQLNLDYNVHIPESFGYAKTYIRESREGPGYIPSHEYLEKMIKQCGELKRAVEKGTEKVRKEDELNNGEPNSLHVINAHIVTSTVPPVDERLASDVSADPFGDFMHYIMPQGNEPASRIWTNKKFMEQFWIGYLEPRVGPSILTPSDRNSAIRLLLQDDRLQEAIHDAVNDELRGHQLPPRLLQDPRIEEDTWTDEVLDMFSGAEGALSKLQYADESTVYDEVKDEITTVFAANPQIFSSMVNAYLSQDDLMKESFIYRQILPRWMPHAGEEHTVYDKNGKPQTDKERYPEAAELWRRLTGLKKTDPEKAEKELQKKKDEEDGDLRIVSAAAGAYIWGHFTQYTGPGNKKTLVEMLYDNGIQLSFEAHFTTQDRELRMWLPHDMLHTCDIINNTKVKTASGRRKTFDVTRVTVDCEHLATQRVDPLDVIIGREDYEDLGIPEELGKFVRMQHVTHPYIVESGSGHQHGPIRFGDEQVFSYTYHLVEKGFAQHPEEFAIVMYEIGGEKTPTLYLLNLIMHMIRAGLTPDDLKETDLTQLMAKKPRDTDSPIKTSLLQQFFGISEKEYHHEWTAIHEHTLDPLQGLLEWEEPTHTWRGRAALERHKSPEEWAREEYR